jgi:hypothetical protein
VSPPLSALQLNSAYPRAVPIHSRLYHGFIDVNDLAFMAVSAGLVPKSHGFLHRLRELMSYDTEHSLEKATNISGRNQFVAVPFSGSLADCARYMNLHTIHRVAVLDPEGNAVCGVVTQANVLAAVHADMSVLGEMVSMTVGALFDTGPG